MLSSNAVRTTLLFGDSHANTFISITPNIIAFPFTAGSAMGLRKLGSISGYRRVLEESLMEYACKSAMDTTICFKFGQVDVDHVFYLKLAQNPELSFKKFAEDSVTKYMSFVDHVLSAGGIALDRVYVMSPFPTVVADAHLRESLCTLPFMDRAFKDQYRKKLDSMVLPTLIERTAHGALYSQLLQDEALRRGLRFIDVHSPLLGGPNGSAALLNPDHNHHLRNAHIPFLLHTLDTAFGRKHEQSVLPSPASTIHCKADAAQPQRLLAWVQLFTSLTSGQTRLDLRGHACSSYRAVVAAFGPPLPFQLSEPTREAPGFATWLVRFLPCDDAPTGVVRILGRYCNYGHQHAWLVQCSTAGAVLVERVRGAIAALGAPDGHAADYSYEVPPHEFHEALSGKRSFS